MKHYLRIALLAAAWLMPHTARSQAISNDSLADQLYMYRVKSVDEFIERFNNEQQSYIRRQLKKRKKNAEVSRAQMVMHLFDADRKDWNMEDVKGFFTELFNPSRKYFLRFTDSTWQLQAQCSFTYEGKPLNIPLRFRIKNTEPAGARWVICAVGGPDLPAAEGYPAPVATPKTRFIPTSSHITNFVTLNDAFRDTENLALYFDPALLASGRANRFMKALATHKLVFNYVTEQYFYFFQVKDWVFRLSRIERNTSNQGWLITDLFRVPESQKSAFLQ